MIYGADNATASVAAALDDITGDAMGKTVTQILELVSRRLESTDSDGDQQMLDSQELDDFEDISDNDTTKTNTFRAMKTCYPEVWLQVMHIQQHREATRKLQRYSNNVSEMIC